MDTIGNMLTRIRNAQLARHERVTVPYSNLSWELANILSKEGFLGDVDKKGRKEKRLIEISLKYDGGVPSTKVLRRISKPGRRIYRKSSEIFPKTGIMRIFSTPRGLLTDKEARKNKVGGELICEVG